MATYAIFVKRKVGMHLRTCESVESQKGLGPQIREVPHLRKVCLSIINYSNPQICGFAICGLICGPTTFAFCIANIIYGQSGFYQYRNQIQNTAASHITWKGTSNIKEPRIYIRILN
jgi:hypothetical protein